MSPKQVLVELAAPDKVTIHQDAEKTVIAFNWFNANHIATAIISGINIFFIYLYGSSLSAEKLSTGFIFPGVYLLFALLFAYHTLTGFWNKTIVTIENQSLSVTYGPLPWQRDRFVKFEQIRAVYFKKDESAFVWRNNIPPAFYAVYAIGATQTRPIIRYVESELTATYLCTQIQAALGEQIEPYWQYLLHRLDEQENDRYTVQEERQIPYPSIQIGDAITALLRKRYRNRLALVANEQRTQFDALYFDRGEGKLYHLFAFICFPSRAQPK